MEERKNKTGFTLIELLITMAIMTIVLAVIYSVYMAGAKSTRSLGLTSGMQMNAQSAIDYMDRELKLTGYALDNATEPAIVTATNNEIMFRYKDESVTATRDDFGNSLSYGTQFRETDYSITGGAIIRTTSLETNNNGTITWVQQSRQPLVNNAAELNFIYYDSSSNKVGTYNSANGSFYLASPNPLGSLANTVAAVGVSITTQEAQKDPVLGILKAYKASTVVSFPNFATTGINCGPIPPVVANVTAADTGVCGSIKVSWTPVSDAYIMGYTVNVQSPQGTGPVHTYSAGPGANTLVVGSYNVDQNGDYIYDIFNGQPATVTVTAEDMCGQISNPSSSYTITPNALAPDAPGWSTPAVSNSGDAVTVSWMQGTNPQDSDIAYYNVYRSVGGQPYSYIGNTSGIYNITYQDSIPLQDTCTPISYEVNAVNACNASLVSTAATSPAINIVDNTQPAPPTGVSGKSGYRRNFLNWTNPSDSLLNSIAIRYNSACSGDPGYPTTLSQGTGVENPQAGLTVANGQLTPEAPGAAGQSYTHTGPGSLPDLGYSTPDYTMCSGYLAQYDYTIFAVSHCGIASNATTINEVTTSQCGEDTSGCAAGAPTWSHSGCSNVSDNQADLSLADACNNYTLTWNRIDDGSSAVYDLAGYYVYGTTDNTAFNFGSTDTKVSGLVLNPISAGVQPQWSDSTLAPGGYPSIDDNPATEGTTHNYYVIPIDCDRETNLGENPWATVDQYNNPLPTPAPTSSGQYSGNVLSVTPGRITFSRPASSNLPYYSSNPANPYNVTGQMSLNNPPSSYSNFMHNNVRLYAYNDSAGTVQLDSMTLSWSNPNVYLARIRRLDTNACIWGTCGSGAPPSISNTVTVNLTASPGTGAIQFGGVSSGGTICNTGVVNGAACALPLKLTFTDQNGNVSSAQDMRGVAVNVNNLTYEKLLYYNSTQYHNFSCTQANPAVTVGALDNVPAPLGPEIIVQGSSQYPQLQVSGVDYASTTTTGQSYPYSAVFNAIAPVYDTSGAGLSGVDLYYTTTAQDQDTPPSLSSFTNQIPMSVNGQSGNQYSFITSTPINVNKNDRVWYLMLDKDNHRNWDMAPEQSAPVTSASSPAAYTFDVGNPCSDTPNPPTGLFATTSPSVIVNGTTGNSITVNWTAPTANTTGTTLTDLAGCNVYVAVNGVLNTTPVYYGACSGSFTDSVTGNNQPSGTLIQYAVIAYDMCHQLGPAEYPGRNISSGNPGSNIIQVQ